MLQKILDNEEKNTGKVGEFCQSRKRGNFVISFKRQKPKKDSSSGDPEEMQRIAERRINSSLFQNLIQINDILFQIWYALHGQSVARRSSPQVSRCT